MRGLSNVESPVKLLHKIGQIVNLILFCFLKLREKLKIVRKRFYCESYMRFGFRKNAKKDGNECPQCVICLKIIAEESMKPAKLKLHLVKQGFLKTFARDPPNRRKRARDPPLPSGSVNLLFFKFISRGSVTVFPFTHKKVPEDLVYPWRFV